MFYSTWVAGAGWACSGTSLPASELSTETCPGRCTGNEKHVVGGLLTAVGRRYGCFVVNRTTESPGFPATSATKMAQLESPGTPQRGVQGGSRGSSKTPLLAGYLPEMSKIGPGGSPDFPKPQPLQPQKSGGDPPPLGRCRGRVPWL
eukprot:gene10364-biopygen9334